MMTFDCITPNDPAFSGKTDTEKIRAAVDKAAETGVNTVVIPRINGETGKAVWSIDGTILLPSHMTVILDGCHLRMADGVIARMFMNSAANTPEGNTAAGRQTDIRILGQNGAVLDGGEPNALNEFTACTGDLPHVFHNLLIYLHNVTDFEIAGFTVTDQRWWAMAFMFASRGRVAHLRFRLTRHALDTNGVWRNQDGIDLRIGCHNILIEDIEGETGDDSIALTALMGFEKNELVEGEERDIHDVIIRDVRLVSNTCALIRLLCHYGSKIYNISISNLFETMIPGKQSRAQMALRFGDDNEHYYKKTFENREKLGEMFNITVDNVFSHAHCLLNLCGAIKGLTARNLHVMEDGGYACFFGYAGVERPGHQDVFLYHPSREAEYREIRFAPFSPNYVSELEAITVENVICDADGTLAPAAIGAANVILRDVTVRGLRTKEELPPYHAFDNVTGQPVWENQR